MFAGDVMTFEHIVDQRDGVLEGRDRFRMRDRNADERGDILAEFARVNRRLVAGDDPAIFEFLDAIDHRRRRQSNLLAELDQRDASLVLQVSRIWRSIASSSSASEPNFIREPRSGAAEHIQNRDGCQPFLRRKRHRWQISRGCRAGDYRFARWPRLSRMPHCAMGRHLPQIKAVSCSESLVRKPQ